MALIDCDRKCRCVCMICSIISSVILGIVAASLRLMRLITFSPAFLWAVLAVSVVVLAVLIAALAYGNQLRECKWKCAILNTLLAGILGTVLFSVLLLGLGCIRSVGLSAVLGGALVAFFCTDGNKYRLFCEVSCPLRKIKNVFGNIIKISGWGCGRSCRSFKLCLNMFYMIIFLYG